MLENLDLQTITLTDAAAKAIREIVEERKLEGYALRVYMAGSGCCSGVSFGMALDNNILIYERIREELRTGKTPRGAVDAGFDRATLTILDANVTTLIAAAVLYQFGTGPVRGFAVTLSLGVVASIFTAVVVSRLVFDYILDTYKVKKISI